MRLMSHPLFRDVKSCLTSLEHGCTWSREPFFKNDDVSLGIFRRTLSDGRKVFAVADYPDDEEMEPEMVQHICRSLDIELSDVHIKIGDGSIISIRPPPTLPPPPTPSVN
jgi:hypothetical protein